jgi:prophage antirepressor-like protein
MKAENTVQVFEGEGFGKVRVIMEGDKPLFIAKDIVEALGLTWGGDRIAHVPSEWVWVRSNRTQNYVRDVQCLTEEGVNFFVIRSDSPKALPVQKWLAGTVIPSIRKHGVYMTEEVQEQFLTDPNTLLRVVQNWKEERDARVLAEQKVLEYTPAHEFVQALEATGDLFYGDEVAKQISIATKLDIGREKFYNWLRQNEFLFKQDRHYPNVVTQKAISMKLIDPKPETVNGRTYIVPKFTVKGLMFFVDTFMTMVENGFAGFDKQGHALYKGEGRAQLSLFANTGGSGE